MYKICVTNENRMQNDVPVPARLVVDKLGTDASATSRHLTQKFLKMTLIDNIHLS